MIPKIAVILTDANRKIIWVNEDFTYITGYEMHEVIGQKPSLLQGPKSEISIIKRIRKALNAQVSIKDHITNYRKNGKVYTCTLVIHPIFNQSNELTNFIAFEVDGDVVKNTDDIPLLQVKNKYQSSSLKGVDETKLYLKLKNLISNEKLYLDPNLTLKSVADQLGTNTKYLSQVVNRNTGFNFQYFINTYRIEEAKKKITSEDYKNLTLYGIALQCGFKNKSTFYKVFKEVTHLTPKDYIKNANQDLN